jgi:hypothetical protein
MIDPGMWTDPKFMRLPERSRLLWIGLISNADDEGRLEGDPLYLKAVIFPSDPLSLEDVEAALTPILEKGMAEKYVVKGETYLHLPNWDKHQTIGKKFPSKFPAPPLQSNTEPVQDMSCIDTELMEDKYSTDTEQVGDMSRHKQNKKKTKETTTVRTDVVRTLNGESDPNADGCCSVVVGCSEKDKDGSDGGIPALSSKLTALGFSADDVCDFLGQYGLERLSEVYAALQRQRVKNPSGWFKKALVEKWEFPPPCPNCGGAGKKTMKGRVFDPCPVCGGSGYNPYTPPHKHKEKKK